ncbi:hypothetical protein FXB70_09095 [Aggregatibacter actinomycetemcomitans]|uniref:Uncharacterized protein n=1 Tax=Aggregatibacter actinomycetemcomitans TaxID=714 RepID=A0AB74N735_AGGAC|nr:hypothetical protein RO04_03460 [Aggregatibacter actinomycetemcomitans]PHO21601.1 hypothetical protein CQR80_00440 [Aggregatibacter actinomycetemcomitans]PHO23840.1 hypothetical protein CQR79_00475 [Aggregatibacter actinomycetemcomitans]TQE40684.1 hypothetical protein SC1000_09940 [Aggregatibacter actinomycetemcomitans]TYA14111.1 hypothetical protein FXE10_08445 [Aggregatibacter actinomycetemcomitans]
MPNDHAHGGQVLQIFCGLLLPFDLQFLPRGQDVPLLNACVLHSPMLLFCAVLQSLVGEVFHLLFEVKLLVFAQ